MVHFSGTEEINASQERVWAFLMDPERFTACAPAMQNVRVKSRNEFTFDIKAPGKTVKFDARWEDRDEPSFARLRMEGGGRILGRARLDNEFRIGPQDGGSSSVAWSSNVEISGMMGALLPDDQLRAIVNEMNQDVIACIRREIEAS
jgi:carbon monoxide dehydrogenase subunit G